GAMRRVRRGRALEGGGTETASGDIVPDGASRRAGWRGLLRSASLGEGKLGLYEPIHGSAPSHAGKDDVNPIATILSAAMLLRHSLGLEEEATALETAGARALDDRLRTHHILGNGARRQVGTQEMAREIAARVES